MIGLPYCHHTAYLSYHQRNLSVYRPRLWKCTIRVSCSWITFSVYEVCANVVLVCLLYYATGCIMICYCLGMLLAFSLWAHENGVLSMACHSCYEVCMACACSANVALCHKLYASLVLLVAMLVTTITSLYDLTKLLFTQLPMRHLSSQTHTIFLFTQHHAGLHRSREWPVMDSWCV